MSSAWLRQDVLLLQSVLTSATAVPVAASKLPLTSFRCAEFASLVFKWRFLAAWHWAATHSIRCFIALSWQWQTLMKALSACLMYVHFSASPVCLTCRSVQWFAVKWANEKSYKERENIVVAFPKCKSSCMLSCCIGMHYTFWIYMEERQYSVTCMHKQASFVLLLLLFKVQYLEIALKDNAMLCCSGFQDNNVLSVGAPLNALLFWLAVSSLFKLASACSSQERCCGTAQWAAGAYCSFMALQSFLT